MPARGRPPAETWSVTDAARLLGVSTRTLQSWLAQGLEHRLVDGQRRVVLADVLRWRVEAERAAARDAAAPDEATERARKLRAEATLKELELERARGQLVEVDRLDEFIRRFVGGFQGTAAGRLARYERRIVAARTPAEARMLTQEIHRALMEGAQEFAAEQRAIAEALELAAQEGTA